MEPLYPDGITALLPLLNFSKLELFGLCLSILFIVYGLIAMERDERRQYVAYRKRREARRQTGNRH